MHEDLAVDGEAVAAAWLDALSVKIEFPPLTRPKTHGGRAGHGKFPLEDVQACIAHQKHVVIADPGDAAVSRNVPDEFIPLRCRVKIEKGQYARIWKFLRIEPACAIKDRDVRSVTDILLRKVVPHRHHGRQNIHRAQGRFFVEGQPAVFLPRTILSLSGCAPALGPGRATQRFARLFHCRDFSDWNRFARWRQSRASYVVTESWQCGPDSEAEAVPFEGGAEELVVRARDGKAGESCTPTKVSRPR